MNLHGADATLFDDALSTQEPRAAQFVPGAIDPVRAHAAGLRAETLLTALAQSEGTRAEDSDEHGEAPLALQRIEAKVDLLLGLFGTLLRERAGLPDTVRLRWSTRGAWLHTPGTAADVGRTGLLRLQPADWLPDCIELPAEVIAAGDDGLWLRFVDLSPLLVEAMERHLFRLHRRQIAESRRQR